MRPLTEALIRASFVNTTLSERKSITLPDPPAPEAWEGLDYLGWRDRKLPAVGYAITWIDDSPVGVLLRQADGRIRTRPQCSWCEDVLLPNDVVLFSAKRSGRAGRNGDTVAALVCSDFECSANVRKRPPVAYLGFDVEAARQARIEALRARVDGFVRTVRDSA
ncbi:MAG: FBP domain-containing protein [Herbiconiux sp.]|nr:FBP domain-containing protein [Herbiconiux sp.]